jgi:hypothetical protein
MKKVLQSGEIPKARFGHEIIQIEDNLFLTSGYTKSGYEIPFLFSMNLKTNQWKKIQTKNEPENMAGITTLYSKETQELIIYGSEKKFLVNHLKLKENLNFEFESKKVSFATRFHSSVIYKDKMFVFGGLREKFQTYEYNLNTFKWETVETFGDRPPDETCHHKSVIDARGRIFLAHTSGLYLYDQFNCQWTRLMKDHKFLKRKNTMVSVGRKIYFIGSKETDNFIYKYDTTDHSVEKISPGDFCEGTLELHASCLCRLEDADYIYTLGGWDDQKIFSDVIYRLDVTEDASYKFNEKTVYELFQMDHLIDVHFCFSDL